MLSKETYLGDLYDIGYDKPETHVIAKGDTLFYAFYDKEWKGPIPLRGLKENGSYRAVDYVNRKEIATVAGDHPVIDAAFNGYLLLAVFPVRAEPEQ
jgi:alpha-galactosidase